MPTTSLTDAAALLGRICDFGKSNRAVALVTVVEADNSTPVKAGAAALVDAEGRIYGTVGGGAAEAEAQKRGVSCLASGESLLFEFDLRGPGVHEASPICGGRMRLFIQPITADALEECARAFSAISARIPGALLLAIAGNPLAGGNSPASPRGSVRFLAESECDTQSGALQPGQLRQLIKTETPALLQLSTGSEIFVSPLIPKPVLLIAGGGHVGQAVAAQAGMAGFDVTVFDDRPEFTQPALFLPRTKTICADPARALAGYPLDRNTFVVIVTRGHQHDSAALRACIRSPAGYIGMIGSRRKVPLVRQQFVEEGWASAEEFDAVYAPIGLDLGAVTVPEIATAIVAQLIQVRRKGAAARIAAAG